MRKGRSKNPLLSRNLALLQYRLHGTKEMGQTETNLLLLERQRKTVS